MADQDTFPRRLLTALGTCMGLVAMCCGAPVRLRALTEARLDGHRR
ncbi:hypothetical protein ACI797_05350 [Geodermatophilus sp. SYSU D00691]